MDLVQEIEKLQLELINLAKKKNNLLNDPEVYQQSCIIDEMIVQYMRLTENK